MTVTCLKVPDRKAPARQIARTAKQLKDSTFQPAANLCKQDGVCQRHFNTPVENFFTFSPVDHGRSRYDPDTRLQYCRHLHPEPDRKNSGCAPARPPSSASTPERPASAGYPATGTETQRHR